MKRKSLFRYFFLLVTSAGCLYGIHQLNHEMGKIIGDAMLYPAHSINEVPDSVRVPSKEVTELDDRYNFQYRFRDQKSEPIEFQWEYDKAEIEEVSKSFGVPLDFFEPFYMTEEVIKQREETMKKGLFHETDGYILPDFEAIVNASQGLTRPVYEMIIDYLGEEASFDSKVDLAMKFCQDIRYHIPDMKMDDRIISGIFPPHISLVKGWGDCDTKAMIFSSILAHDPSYEVIAVTVPGHLYLAIKGVPKPYQQSIEYQGQKYIVCEPVGPGRLPFGKKTPHALNPVKRIDKVFSKGQFSEAVSVDPIKSLPKIEPKTGSSVVADPDEEKDLPANTAGDDSY